MTWFAQLDHIRQRNIDRGVARQRWMAHRWLTGGPGVRLEIVLGYVCMAAPMGLFPVAMWLAWEHVIGGAIALLALALALSLGHGFLAWRQERVFSQFLRNTFPSLTSPPQRSRDLGGVLGRSLASLIVVWGVLLPTSGLMVHAYHLQAGMAPLLDHVQHTPLQRATAATCAGNAANQAHWQWQFSQQQQAVADTNRALITQGQRAIALPIDLVLMRGNLAHGFIQGCFGHHPGAWRAARERTIALERERLDAIAALDRSPQTQLLRVSSYWSMALLETAAIAQLRDKHLSESLDSMLCTAIQSAAQPPQAPLDCRAPLTTDAWNRLLAQRAALLEPMP